MKRPFVIAEAGVNHNGDLGRALAMVDAAQAAGADCIKFQAFDTAKLIAAGTPTAAYQARNTGEADMRAMVAKLELSRADFARLAARCSKVGIEFLCTAFDEDFIDDLIALGMKRIKIASGELTNKPALERFAKAGLPIFLSTGMASDAEVDEAIFCLRTAGARDLTVLQCTSIYPAPPALANLNAMVAMGRRNGIPFGYSDHTLDDHLAIAASALGASVIEKHFTLDCALPGPDHRASLDPKALTRMVKRLRETAEGLGSALKAPGPEERATAAIVRRSWHAARALEAGTVLKPSDLILKRPANGLPPARSLDGCRLKRALAADQAITEDALEA